MIDLNYCRKTTWPILLGLLLLAAPAAVQAQFDYATNNGAITLTAYTGAGGAVVISNFVTSIEWEAFDGCTNLTSVAIPVSVTNIGDAAFFNCSSLTSITIPGSVTSIGQEAFYDCASLTNVTIVNGVTSIGESAFGRCSGLTSVTVSGSVTNIGFVAFYNCGSLTTITVDAQNLFYSSTNGVLFNADQTTLIQYPLGLAGSYTIPGSVTSIGDYAFNYARLTSVTIPGSVTSIGNDAFEGCASLTAITVDPNNSFYSDVDGVLFNQNQTTLVQYPGGLAGSYKIPGSVAIIGLVAFSGCDGLTSVTIPGSVTNIGAYAFEDCTGLTNVTIANGLNSIDTAAFDGCNGLTSVTLPSSVTYLSEYAFAYCSDLTKVYFDGNAPGVYEPFEFDPDLRVFYLPGTTGWSGFAVYTGHRATLWNPLIQMGDGSFGVQNNQFGFNITSAGNLTVVVAACTNLASPVWTPITTNTLVNGSFHFSDPQWTNYPNRFYSLQMP
jgi:hypothetical protein